MRDAFHAQIAMYHPSEPVSMTQTNSQQHYSTSPVHRYRSAHLNLPFARSKFQDFTRGALIMSDAEKAHERCLPCPNSNVPPFRASFHDPNKQSAALLNLSCPSLQIGTPESAFCAIQISRFRQSRGNVRGGKSPCEMPSMPK